MPNGNKKTIQRLISYVLDSIFPPHCLCCEQEGQWMCEQCRTHLRRVYPAQCPLCTASSSNGYVCFSCYQDTGIQQIVSVFHFNQKGIKELVHALKYENIRSVAPWMGKCMTAAWQLHGSNDPEFLIPIPLHTSRLREREYNQAALLAFSIQKELGVKMDESILVRSRKTASQTELSSLRRKENMRGCFSLAKKEFFATHVLLIDDVFTTGATLCEAAGVLRKAGIQSVSALVFAHD